MNLIIIHKLFVSEVRVLVQPYLDLHDGCREHCATQIDKHLANHCMLESRSI
jgi:hypothetical protein